jgi:hypothetical protein
MAVKKTPTAFAEAFEEGTESNDEVVVEEPVIVTNGDSDLITARVKGTWTMFWGQLRFEFKDGNRYKLPKDLFNYLRSHGNIYDTL